VQRVHFLGVEADLCDLKSVYALADKLLNGTVGSPEATTMDGLKLPHGSPGTYSYSKDIVQDRWALSQEPGSIGAQRAWGWGLSGIRLPRLDVIILSAGIGGWAGLNWVVALRDVLFDTVNALTWPQYKLGKLGAVVKSQKSTTKQSDETAQPLLANQEKSDEPPLGEVFCANVFGHYILAHELTPLLSKASSPSSKTGGRIIWVSSVEALDHFSIDDIQGLNTTSSYESSKRLVDLLVLSSELPSVRRIAEPFFNASKTVTASKSSSDDQEGVKTSCVEPKMFLTHPGVFVSDIMPIPLFLSIIFRWLTYIARWLGSPWHTIYPYEGAVSAVWIALMSTQEIEDMEGHGARKAKWGSAADASGNERVLKTEVPGWGWDGQVGGEVDEERRKGRKSDAADVTKESREDFEVLGVKCWRQMEELREQWEDILGVKSGKE